MSAHTCHAEGCDRRCPPKMLMCAPHWQIVPKDRQDAVWATYRPGQERDKRPSRDWLDAAFRAINAVARSEGRPVPRPALEVES